MDSMDALCVLCGQGGRRRHSIAAVGRDDLLISLKAPENAGVFSKQFESPKESFSLTLRQSCRIRRSPRLVESSFSTYCHNYSDEIDNTFKHPVESFESTSIISDGSFSLLLAHKSLAMVGKRELGKTGKYLRYESMSGYSSFVVNPASNQIRQ